MYDFIKLKFRNETYQPQKELDPLAEVNLATGEHETPKYKFREQVLRYYPSGNGYLQGSLHHYHHGQNYNADRFYFFQAQNAIYNLCEQVKLFPNELTLGNLEFGVNINLGFNLRTNLFNELLFHRSHAFYQPKGISYVRESKKNGFRVKLYDKGMQCKQRMQNANTTQLNHLFYQTNTTNLLRYELGYKRMATLNKIGIHTLLDLGDPTKAKALSELLLNEWNEVFLFEKEIDTTLLNKSELENFNRFRYPKYWQNLNRSNKNKKKKVYKDILKKQCQTYHREIRSKIQDELDEILYHQGDILHGNFERLKRLERRHIARSSIDVICSQPDPSEKRVCSVTGIDITMQKDSSHFLWITGVKYYYENAPNLYRDLKQKFLPNDYNDMEKNFYYIAHNIRNADSNARHGQKRKQLRLYPPHQLRILEFL